MPLCLQCYIWVDTDFLTHAWLLCSQSWSRNLGAADLACLPVAQALRQALPMEETESTLSS